MRLYFANSAWIAARERLVLRKGQLKTIHLPVRYGLLIHEEHGPVLIDTGYTPESLVGSNRSFMLRLYGWLLGPKLIDAQQPAAILARFGFTPQDVETIIVTHMHTDHISGLKQFPNARLIVHPDACEKFLAASSFANARHGLFRELLPDDFADRRRFCTEFARWSSDDGVVNGWDIFGDQSVLMTPLPGHGSGHCGLFIKQAESYLLYATDTSWLLRAVTEDRFPGFPASLVAEDGEAAALSVEKVKNIAAQGCEVLLCHDPEITRFDLFEPANA